MGLIKENNAVGKTNSESMFSNRVIAIATMHKKEQVIAPLLRKSFDIQSVVPEIDTDVLGTFSGEIERTLSPIDAARSKCEMAFEITGCDLALSSEGSFGSHPFIPFATADEEVVLLIDKKNELEIWGRSISVSTNFDGKIVNNSREAIQFARKSGFPQHALIVRDKKDSLNKIVKGINSHKKFESTVESMLSNFGKIWIETDMRAMYNPRRMLVIQSATENLIERMNSSCPSCLSPGYWVKEVIPGLPCCQCGFPTKSTLAHLYGCYKCKYLEEVKYPNNRTVEEPGYCDVCNP